MTRRSLWGSVREALGGTNQDFTTGKLTRGVFLLAIPMVLEMVSESLFFLVDLFLVRHLGANAVAAVTVTEGVLGLVYSLAVGLAMATTAMVARRVGEKDKRGAASAAVQAIALATIVGVGLGILGASLAPRILAAMGADAEVVAAGTTFARIQMGGMVVIILLFVNNAVYRGAGDATMAMRSVWLANLINIVLDPILIFGVGPIPGLGLAGAAIATTTGRGIGALYQLRGLSSGSRITIRRADLSLVPSVMRRLLRVARGGVLQFLVPHVSYLVSMRILAAFGTAALAGYGAAIRVVVFIILPAWGLSNAAATLVGQNLGAGKPERAESAVYVTGLWNMGFLALVTIVFVWIPEVILTPFTPDAETLEVGARALRIMSYGYIFYAWGMVSAQAFNGAGDTVTPTWINAFVFYLYQLPAAALFAFTFGMEENGVFWSITSAYSLSAVVGLWLFRRGRWKQKSI